MKLERQDGVGILTIDTEHNNAINPEFIKDAHRLMDEVEHDPTIRSPAVADLIPGLCEAHPPTSARA